MKELMSGIVVMILCGAIWGASNSSAEAGSAVTGEISDSQCAFNVHSKTKSHKEMTESHTMGATPAECVRTCVKQMGGQYVLVSGEKVFRMDRQDLAEQFAGQKVRVKGKIDESEKFPRVKVESITPES